MELKRISAESIPRAIAKAERYRLINEPRESESICRDILEVDPSHQEALSILLLALTDQFPIKEARVTSRDALEILERLEGEYERAYYAGVIAERAGKTMLHSGYASDAVYETLREAMESYESALRLAPKGNEDAALRWNTCARMIERAGLGPAEGVHGALEHFDDEVPWRSAGRSG